MNTDTVFISPNSHQFSEYLFEKQAYPYGNEPYRFLIIDADEDEDPKRLVDFLEDLIPDSTLMKIGTDYLLFHLSLLDLEIKNVASSISDDFGITIRLFSSGKMNPKKPEHFWKIYDAYKKYIVNRGYDYAGISDLILEIIKTDLKCLKIVKEAILNRVHEDSQLEKLIYAMFHNNLNVTQTANEVFMHRNTIINKLEYIRSETGLNLQNFKDALCMYWLIKA